MRKIRKSEYAENVRRKYNMNQLQKKYNEELSKQLKDTLGVKNTMAVPKIKKIVVNMGVKDALADKKNIERAAEVMVQITGQKPRINKAKKSIATFKLREGDEVGVSVTLRGERMYDFFQRLISIVLPRIRDFRGVRRESFDKMGNYNLGFTEGTVFPEIDPSKLERVQGLEITIVTTAKTDEGGFELLKALGMPFVKN